MIADTWLLLGLRARLAVNGFRNRSPVRQALIVAIAALVGLAAGGGAGAMGFGLGRLARRFPAAGIEGLVPGAILTLVAFILLFGSFGLALGSLYLATDLDLLLAAPIDRRAVFLVKLSEGFGLEYAIVAVTALPALLAFGIGAGFGPAYLALAILAVLAAPILPALIGALLVLIVARVAPVRRVRDVLGVAGALIGIGIGLIGQTPRLWTGRLGALGPDPAAALAPLQALARLPIPPLIAGQGLTAAGRGDLPGAIAGLGVYFGVTAALFAAGIWAADRLYDAGWLRLQGTPGGRRRGRGADRRDGAWLGRLPAAPAIALKDWIMIPRDLRYFIQLLSPLVFLPVVSLNLIGGSRGHPSPAIEAAARFGRGAFDPAGVFVAIGILLATATLFTQVASTGISREARAWWLIRTAPVSAHQILAGKFLAAWVPFVALSTLLLAAASLWQGFSPAGFLHGWFGIEVLGAGMLALATGLAVPWARLDWTNPTQMRSTWGVLLSYLGELIIGVVGGGLLCLPLIAGALAPDLVPLTWALAVIGPILVGVAAAALATWVGLSHLAAVGEG